MEFSFRETETQSMHENCKLDCCTAFHIWILHRHLVYHTTVNIEDHIQPTESCDLHKYQTCCLTVPLLDECTHTELLLSYSALSVHHFSSMKVEMRSLLKTAHVLSQSRQTVANETVHDIWTKRFPTIDVFIFLSTALPTSNHMHNNLNLKYQYTHFFQNII